MFVKLTLEDNREIWLRAMDIKSVEKAPQELDPKTKSPIIGASYSVVATTLITSQGPFAYKVKEEPAEIAQAVAKVLQDLPSPALNPAQR
jgi:hypothetical protein